MLAYPVCAPYRVVVRGGEVFLDAPRKSATFALPVVEPAPYVVFVVEPGPVDDARKAAVLFWAVRRVGEEAELGR